MGTRSSGSQGTRRSGWSWYDDRDPRNHKDDPEEVEKVKRARLDYILVSDIFADYINEARIINPLFKKGTDNRIDSINIQFNSFVRGVGYYRCPPDLLSDEIFKGVLRTTVCSIISKHTSSPFIEDTKLQYSENLKPPIEIVEEIIKETGTVTANYHKRKKGAIEADRKNILEEIKTLKQIIDQSPMEDPISEANIAYLEDALKHIDHNTASNEVKITRNKPQFKATQVKDKLSRPPPRKSTITEIITETQNANGSSTQVKHTGQLNTQTTISNFYTTLYAHNPCQESLDDIEKFLEGVEHKTVSKEENKKLTEEVTEQEVHEFIKTISTKKAPGDHRT